VSLLDKLRAAVFGTRMVPTELPPDPEIEELHQRKHRVNNDLQALQARIWLRENRDYRPRGDQP
jgi:hypothetical protein